MRGAVGGVPFAERLLGSRLGAPRPLYPLVGCLPIHHSDTVVYMVRFHLCWNRQKDLLCFFIKVTSGGMGGGLNFGI